MIIGSKAVKISVVVSCDPKVLELTTSDFSFNLSGVVRHQGLPVAGVEVLIFDVFDESTDQSQMRVPGANANPVGSIKTNLKGEFAFGARSGTYRLEFAPNPATRFLKHVVKEITVTANTSCVVNLSTGLLLSGRASRADGKPLRGGAMVGLCIEPSLYLATSYLSLDGDYNLVVPKGKFQLAYRPCLPDFSDEDFVTGGIDPDDLVPSLATTEEVVSVHSDSRFDLVLPPLVEFNGEVVAGSQPVADALITVVPSQVSENPNLNDLVSIAQSKSDSQGKFKLYLQPGTYDISINPPDGSHLFGLNQSRKNVKDNGFERFVLPAGFCLKGQAVYGDQILSDCLVRVLAIEQDRAFLAKTDANGEFELSLPAGDYCCIVSAHPKDSPTKTINGVEYAGLAPHTGVVAVRNDTRVAFDLQEGTALYGRVVDATSGKARAGVRVSVYLDSDFDAKGDNKRTALSSAITDAQGNYCFFLSPGAYWLTVLKDFANAKQVLVGAEPTCVDVIWQGWCQLRFEVLGEDGVKIARCKFKSSKYSIAGAPSENQDRECAADCSLLTGEDGICCVTLPQGIYTFEFEPPKGSSYAGKTLRQLSVSADLIRKVSLPFKDSIQRSDRLAAQPQQN